MLDDRLTRGDLDPTDYTTRRSLLGGSFSKEQMSFTIRERCRSGVVELART